MKTKNPFYHTLSDPANQKHLLRAFRKAAKSVSQDKKTIASESSYHFVRLKGGRVAQVYVAVKEYDPVLLDEQPMTGGLLVNKMSLRERQACKALGVKRLASFTGAEQFSQGA